MELKVLVEVSGYVLRSKYIPYSKFFKWAVQSPHEETPWQEIFSSLAATAGRTLPSPLQIRRSFKNVVIRHQNAASHAEWQRKTTRGVPAAAIVRLLHRVRLSSARAAASQRLFLLSRAAIGPYFAAIATRLAKAVVVEGEAPPADADGTRIRPLLFHDRFGPACGRVTTTRIRAMNDRTTPAT